MVPSQAGERYPQRIDMLAPGAEWAFLGSDLLDAARRVMESGQFINGREVRAVEAELADFLDIPHVIGVASGTDALHLALLALGVGPGDEVVTTPFTFIATAFAISRTGAQPVFADIEPDSFNLDPEAVAARITSRTKAVIVVHLYGRPAALDALSALCRSRDLYLIEDGAQAFGSTWEGRSCGTIGDVGCFSFYPTKNLGALGDAGAVVTSSDGLADRIRRLKNHGAADRSRYVDVGYNSRLDEIQAAFLRVKLPHVRETIRRRRAHAALYEEVLSARGHTDQAGNGVPQDLVTPGMIGGHTYNQYTVRSPHRDAVRDTLAEHNIASAIYYPVPLHQQPALAQAAAQSSCQYAEQAAETVISLPVSPWLDEKDIRRVGETLRAALRRNN